MAVEKQELNRFFVDVFNGILRTEERCLAQKGRKDISIQEIHVIEAVSRCEENGTNTAAEVAKRLWVTAGSLTTAVIILERKGYLMRVRDEQDRRKVRLCLTEAGRDAQADHAAFHRQMLEEVASILNEEELEALVRGLSRLNDFFEQRAANKKA